MESLTFICPSCGQPLKYDFDQAGDPYECPGCHARGTLPGIDLEPLEELESEEAADTTPDTVAVAASAPAGPLEHAAEKQILEEHLAQRQQRKLRRRAWRPIRLGLTVLLGAWLAVGILATILLLLVIYRCLQVLFPVEPTEVGQGLAGVLGILFFLAEGAALYGYRLCLEAPREERLRDWAWITFGMAAARNFACLATSIVYLVVSPEAHTTLGIFTILAAGLFFGHWFLWLLDLRQIAYALRAQWLMQMAWNTMFIMGSALLGWLLLLCGFFSFAGGTEAGLERMGLIEGGLLRIFISCGGTVLAVVLWLAVVWQLRLLNFLRESIDA